jgi:AraC-like DNA-binding protein
MKPGYALRALDILRENCAGEWSLETLAKELGVSPFHLSHMLSRELGMGFSELLQRLRIGKAKEILAGGGSAKEASYLLGFSDQAYFTKVFKKLEGRTRRVSEEIAKSTIDPGFTKPKPVADPGLCTAGLRKVFSIRVEKMKKARILIAVLLVIAALMPTQLFAQAKPPPPPFVELAENHPQITPHKGEIEFAVVKERWAEGSNRGVLRIQLGRRRRLSSRCSIGAST